MTESDEVDGEIDRHALALDEAAGYNARVKVGLIEQHLVSIN
jgi:hypothetical protein